MTKLAQHWTSVEAQLGFRHFRVVGQGGRSPERWVELVAVLDATQRLRLPLRDLRDPALWSSGLQPVVEDMPDMPSDPALETEGSEQEPLPE